HPTAGKVYRHEPTVHTHWQTLFGEATDQADLVYTPFSSCIEWELAQWAIKENIPQRSFDCLLQIPEVVPFPLGMLGAILHEFITWYTKCLSFKDRPNEYFTVCHQDPLEAIKGLWGDPAFTQDLVYKLAKLFQGTKETEEERMFSEMWTGGLWNAVQ
ncbi:hypothetical protein GYMLUDRAFT_114825, partial [Collybiopsis luxurians FD-317 M1]